MLIEETRINTIDMTLYHWWFVHETHEKRKITAFFMIVRTYFYNRKNPSMKIAYARNVQDETYPSQTSLLVTNYVRNPAKRDDTIATQILPGRSWISERWQSTPEIWGMYNTVGGSGTLLQCYFGQILKFLSPYLFSFFPSSIFRIKISWLRSWDVDQSEILGSTNSCICSNSRDFHRFSSI